MTENQNDPQPAAAVKADEKKQPPPAKKNTGFADGLWKFFSSVHLAVILLLILATISIIGTVLAQGDSAEDNIQLFENMIVKVFDTLGIVDADDPASVSAKHDRIHVAAERLHRFSMRAGFTNLYHAWYFYLILALFSFNLLVCSIKRWPHTWKLIARNPVALDEKRFKTMSNRRAVTLDLSLEEAVTRVKGAMKKARFSSKSIESEGVHSFFGQKGSWSRLGVYATHSSILLILIGGIIGVTSGYKGYMQIVEGTSESRFFDRRSKTTKLFDFQVRCDNFKVDYYEGSRQPKDYFSDLVVLKDGEEIISKRIEVNDPLVYYPGTSRFHNWPVIGWFTTKIYFYQSSFGETGRGTQATLRVAAPGAEDGHVEKFTTAPRTFDDLGVTVQILQILPEFALDENQQPYAKSNQPKNPAALVEVKGPDDQARRTWLFLNYPDVQMVKDIPVDIKFLDYGGIQYTGLQVVYDPGVWVIWFGCTIMVLGTYLAFFMSHRRVWARVAEEEGKVTVLLAGSANKNRDGFKVAFERLGNLVAGEEAEKKES